jgi:anti-sigma factor RsiW
MMDRFTDRLSEYMDGDLSPEDARRVEAHLHECETCARSLEELRGVVARASAVMDRAVPEDLWPAIAARLQSDAATAPAGRSVASTVAGNVVPWRRRRIALSIPQLAAAAILLVALAGGTAWLARPGALHNGPITEAAGGPGAGVGTPGVIPAADTGVESASAAVRYAIAIDELEQALFKPDAPLPPSTEAKIRNSLRTIDRAIEDARRALEDVPTDGYLRQHLTATMRRKVDFLRRTTRLVAQS